MSVRFRVTWALLSVFLVECLVFGLAMLPGALLWEFFALRTYPFVLVRIVVLSMAFVPAYGLFAFSLMVLSALSTRWLGWRTPVNVDMPIKALEWPLLCWVRYRVSVHVVRLFAGSVFRATPLWTFYLRLNGARLGRGVYVNSLAVNDHDLLEFGDRVVIGDGAFVGAHRGTRGRQDGGRSARRPRHDWTGNRCRHRCAGRRPLPGRCTQSRSEVLATEG